MKARLKSFGQILIVIFSFLAKHPQLMAQEENRTPPYSEIISYYHQLDSLYSAARLIPYGRTDVGLPLHLFIISRNGIFDPVRLHELGICILFINNGIHPGEPDGINASMRLAKELLENDAGKLLLEHVAICIIPVFNIDGALQRGCCSRANQDGPEEYGFRGNAQNLDLNRDFIKNDAMNTQSWIKIFRQWDPDVLVDTHVSDGADYQYTLTLLASQHDKMHPALGNYMKEKLVPSIFEKMKKQGKEICPYVDSKSLSGIPDSGISAFLETPRFITGYATLFNTFSFMSESHMLKPFHQRVEATFALLHSILEICGEQHEKILAVRTQAKKETPRQVLYPVNWSLDTTRSVPITFRGYTAAYKTSNVSGLQRLYYDHNKPYEKKIPFYEHYYAADTIVAPAYYLLPQAWHRVIELLDHNEVHLIQVKKDSTTQAEVYYINKYSTTETPYEGHYLHYNTSVTKKTEQVQIRYGDFLVPVSQESNRLIVETLEPQTVDSYFNWGFFDSILQEKEWFSSYVFEDVAEKILKDDPGLQKEFDLLRKADSSFAKDAFAQLNYIYRHSVYFEKSYNRYPVCRIMK